MSVTYWQVSAGYYGREYSKVFLKHGIAFVGDDKHAIMDKVRANDRIILKRGRSEITAVGKIVERDGKVNGNNDKEWLKDFDGWNLSSYCYVEWHELEPPLVVKGLTMGAIQAVHKEHIKKLVETNLIDVETKGFESEPKPTKKVEDAEMLDFLIREGLRPGAAEDLTATFNRIRLLAKYYQRECKWEDIREHETRTFLILPLLLAIGWPEQQIKIELGIQNRRRIDVACFSKPYMRDGKNDANNEDCALILESKGFSQGLDSAPEQVKNYAEYFPNCPVVVVSNGYCYKAYLRDNNGEFNQEPSAYLNLLNPRDKYPINPDNVKGSLELLRYLLPTSVIQLMNGSKI